MGEPEKSTSQSIKTKITEAVFSSWAEAAEKARIGTTVDGTVPMSDDKIVFAWDPVSQPVFNKAHTMSSRAIGTGPYPLPGPPVSPPKLPTYKYSDGTDITPERLLQFGFQFANADTGWLHSPDHMTTLRAMLNSGTWLLDVRGTPERVSVPVNPPQDMGDVQRLVDALGLRQPTHPSVARVVRFREEEVKWKLEAVEKTPGTPILGPAQTSRLLSTSLTFNPPKAADCACGHCTGIGRIPVTALNGTPGTITCPYCNGTGTI